MEWNRQAISICIACCLLSTGCGIYTFRPVYVSPEVKSVSIAYFPNQAAVNQPILSQRITETLKDVFNEQSNLNVTGAEGDIRVQGSITGYDITPVAVQGNETAAMTRLTIRIQVNCINTKEEKKDFEAGFSRFADFSNDKDLSQVEDALLTDICQQLAQDVFDRIMINW